MRLITADVIFTGNGAPIKNGLIAMEMDGTIIDIIDPQTTEGTQFLSRDNLPVTEYFEGFICPGFVNAHCHLELSHMKRRLSERGGLPQFIREIVASRNDVEQEQILLAIEKAELEMIQQGIVAVGDICNTADTLHAKQNSTLLYHNFIEVFDLDPARADENFEKGKLLAGQFAEAGQERVSITPHAPYSVSLDLLKKLNSCAYEQASLLTIHNQETESENEMFRVGTGALAEIMKNFGAPQSKRWPTGFSSLASTLVHLLRCNRILMVHNTYTSDADVTWAKQYSNQVWWCLCPNANLFIEDRLPDISMFSGEASTHLLIGTDSYASNWSLSVLDELKTIEKHFPKIPLDEMLKWATKNGAAFFGWKHLGTLEKGKKPGLNHIADVDTEFMRLKSGSRVLPLVTTG